MLLFFWSFSYFCHKSFIFIDQFFSFYSLISCLPFIVSIELLPLLRAKNIKKENSFHLLIHIFSLNFWHRTPPPLFRFHFFFLCVQLYFFFVFSIYFFFLFIYFFSFRLHFPSTLKWLFHFFNYIFFAHLFFRL